MSEKDESKNDNLTRKQFLKTGSALVAEKLISKSLKRQELSVEKQESSPSSLIESAKQNARFIKENPELLDKAYSLITHPDLREHIGMGIYFYPPLVDFQIFEIVLEEGPGSKKDDKPHRNIRWKERVNNQIKDLLTAGGYPPGLPASLKVDSVINRWSDKKKPFLSYDKKQKTEEFDIIEALYPIPVPINEETSLADNEFSAFNWENEIVVAISDKLEIFDKNLTDKERDRLKAIVVCHELVHALDIIIDPSLARSISPKELAEIYNLRLSAIDLVSFREKEYIDSWKSLHSPLASEEDRNDLRVTYRAVFGDIHTLSAKKISDQALYYPREVWEWLLNYKDGQEWQNMVRSIDVSWQNSLSIPDARKIITFLGAIHREHMAEMGGAYLYLLAGFEVENGSDKDLIRELEKYPTIAYIKKVIQVLGAEKITEQIDEVQKKIKDRQKNKKPENYEQIGKTLKQAFSSE